MGTGLGDWQYLAVTLHIGGLRLWSLFAKLGQWETSAASQMTEQPYLGWHCSPMKMGGG